MMEASLSDSVSPFGPGLAPGDLDEFGGPDVVRLRHEL
jgi:hypothetical protein